MSPSPRYRPLTKAKLRPRPRPLVLKLRPEPLWLPLPQPETPWPLLEPETQGEGLMFPAAFFLAAGPGTTLSSLRRLFRPAASPVTPPRMRDLATSMYASGVR